MYRIPMYAHQHCMHLRFESGRASARKDEKRCVCKRCLAHIRPTNQPPLLLTLFLRCNFTPNLPLFIADSSSSESSLVMYLLLHRFLPAFSLSISSLARTLKTETHLIVEKVGMVWMFQRHLFYHWQMFESIIIFDGFACLYRLMVDCQYRQTVGRFDVWFAVHIAAR